MNAIYISYSHYFTVIFFYTFVTEEKEVEGTVKHLENLVKHHDVTFLLLDSREARWLPTLITTFHCKVCSFLSLYFIYLDFFFYI